MDYTTSRDGTKIAFRRSGSGPPLLLVHGTTADHRRWDAVSPRLEPHFTVYAMDRRGRGGSGDAPDYGFRREAEDVAAVVEAIGGPVFVLGHSFGGRCSLEAALLTDKIDRLILYEPSIPAFAPSVPPDVPDRIQALAAGGEPEAALELFFREMVGMPEEELAAYRRLPMWPGRIQLAPTIGRELRVDQTYGFDPAKFTGLRVPTLLLLGGSSPPDFRTALERIDATLPDSRIVVLPGQRHIAMDTAPELFVAEVVRFLSE
jgi:pimeloyl-ACP methyl ester carboxylesterase